jgi:hypothetical protein
VAAAGDVNGDGYDDVIVSGLSSAAYVFHGSASGIPSGDPTTAATELLLNQSGAVFRRVAGAGDVNGDGYDDVIVGAPEYDVGNPEGPGRDAGAAFVFHGSPNGIPDGTPATAATRLLGDIGYAPCGNSYYNFGGDVAGVGDLNGDGRGDVIVSSPARGTESGGEGSGAAWIFTGAPLGIPDGGPSTAQIQLETTARNFPYCGFNLSPILLGSDVDGAGDLDGDGKADVILSLPGYNSRAGAAYVYTTLSVPEPPAGLALAAGAMLVFALRRARRA